MHTTERVIHEKKLARYHGNREGKEIKREKEEMMIYNILNFI